MVVATGFFDGVHLGHRLVIKALVDEARARGEESLVLTFWPHPRTVLQNGARALRLLTSLEEKKALLKSLGVDRIEVLEFTREFSAMSTEDYLCMLRDRYSASAIVLGYDNRMGRNAGSTDSIAASAEALGLDVIRTSALSLNPSSTVSSTAIRCALEEGRVADAADMLGYRYALKGVVVGGRQVGRTIGFPTANLRLYDPLKLVPAVGVYFVEVETLNGHYWGMCNVADRIETHIFDFSEHIYGLDLKVSFVCRVRDEIQFKSLDLLKQQLQLDREACRALIPE